MAVAWTLAALSGCVGAHAPGEPSAPPAAALVGSPDPNGYLAQYECRKGNPNCDVDVAALTKLPCEQTITTGTAPTTDWSAVDWSKHVICIEAGDHTGRGTLTMAGNGSAPRWNVLRSYRAGDQDEDPWEEAAGNRARLFDLVVNGSAYWIVHRLAFDAHNVNTPKVDIRDSNHVIVNRLLAEDFLNVGGSGGQVGIDGSSDITVQNSVVRNCGSNPDVSPGAILFGNGENLWVVNNETYDCAHIIFTWQTGTPTPDAVVENNDIYITPSYRTDCRGNADPNGACSRTESHFSTKADGAPGRPYKVLHNRLWGARHCDLNAACDGGGGATQLGSIGGGAKTADWILFKNNILFDSQQGYSVITLEPDGTDRNSIVGNVFWNLKNHYPSDPVQGLGTYAGGGSALDTTELYLNTFVDIENSNGANWIDTEGLSSWDIRCNAVIDSPGLQGPIGNGTEVDFNAYYAAPDSRETNPRAFDIAMHATATTYQVGNIVRLANASSCTKETDAACFLYRVTGAGISAGTPPSYCTSLGCTTQDGTATLKAVRGPHCFYRKLRTAPEQVCIPYAAVDQSAPDYGFCKSAGLGSRADIGVNDEIATFDGTGSGVLGTDLAGSPRLGTPGAIEFTPPKPKSDGGADSGPTRNDPDGGPDRDGWAGDGGITGDNRLPSSPSADAPAGCSCRSVQSLRASPTVAFAGILFATVAARRWRRKRRLGRASAALASIRFLVVLALLFPPLATAADPNGYTSQYDCRVGGPHCNVDVAGLTQQACEQTISPSTSPTSSWDAIDWSKNVICIEAGDHTGRGKLTLQSNGTSSARKVLRYYRSGDSDDQPWTQSDENRAKISLIDVTGAYWTVHRITLPSNTLNGWTRFSVHSANTILNRILVEGPGGTDACQDGVGLEGDNNVLQNSVVRDARRCTGGSPVAVSIVSGTDVRVVNNEISNWCEHQIQAGYNEVPSLPGLAIENNDLYLTSAIYNGNGDAAAGWLLSFKTKGTPGNPVKAIHNRLSGSRTQIESLCGTGDSGHAIGFNANAGANNEYVLVQNNIVTDSIGGVGAYNYTIQNIPIIGNLFYDIGNKGTALYSRAISFYSASRWEVYLNTIVNFSGLALFGEWDGDNLDIRVNTVLNSVSSESGSHPSSSTADNNAFYGTPSFAFNGTSTDITQTLTTRSNNQSLSLGQVIRTTSTPPANGTAGDFLYITTTAGQTAGSAPTYCTTLGCTIADGSATVRAIRAPHTFYRKLRTGPEQAFIPYAAIDPSAPEYAFCKATPPGSRAGIGVNDEVGTFDGTGDGLFGTDLDGTPRLGTPGALEFTALKPKSDAGADGGRLGNDPDGGLDGGPGTRDGGVIGDNRLPASPSTDSPAGCSCRSARSSGASPAGVFAGIVFAAAAARRWRGDRRRSSSFAPMSVRRRGPLTARDARHDVWIALADTTGGPT